MATRAAMLDLAPLPTLDDVIRGVILPVQSTGDSATFTIPNFAQENDLAVWFVTTHQYFSFETLDGNYIDFGATDSEWWVSYVNAQAMSCYDTGEASTTGDFPGLTTYVGTKIINADDIGETFTVSFDHDESYLAFGVGTDATYANPIFFMVVLKNDHYDTSDGSFNRIEDGYYYSYECSGTQTDYVACGTYTSGDPDPLVVKPVDIVFPFRSNFEASGIGTPPIGTTTLCDETGSEVSLYVGAKIVRRGLSVSYPTPSENHFNGLAGLGVN